MGSLISLITGYLIGQSRFNTNVIDIWILEFNKREIYEFHKSEIYEFHKSEIYEFHKSEIYEFHKSEIYELIIKQKRFGKN